MTLSIGGRPLGAGDGPKHLADGAQRDCSVNLLQQLAAVAAGQALHQTTAPRVCSKQLAWLWAVALGSVNAESPAGRYGGSELLGNIRHPMSRDNPSLFEEFTGLTVLKAALLVIPSMVLIVASIWVTVQFLDPLPPRQVMLAAGPLGSELHTAALRYADSVSRKGIKVEVIATQGAADNLDRLVNLEGQPMLGFVMAGMATPEQAQKLVNLSNLAHVPLWCLARLPSGEVMIAGLRGQRLAIGASGSGLNAWLLPLLQVNGITSANTNLLEMTPDESVRALSAGQVDAVFLAEPHGPVLREALSLPGVRLMGFPRAEAYARLFLNIVPLHLPAGTLDLAHDVPKRDLALIGTSIMLSARADVHPTVVDLFVDAARALQSGKDIFARQGEFPNLNVVDSIPVSQQAIVYAREGPTLLRRYLPLWAADALQRMIILAVPLLAVVLPLVRYVPTLFNLLERRHLLLGYAGLRRIDRTARARRPDEPMDDLVNDLRHIEESVAGVRESVFKASELYTFRVHAKLVRDAVLGRVHGPNADQSEAEGVSQKSREVDAANKVQVRPPHRE